MEALATELTHRGRTLRQLKRTGMIAIYDVRNRGNMLYGYEVIKIKIAPAEEIFGRMYWAREVYPSSSRTSDDWGTSAWSFGTQQKKQAFAMFNGLVETERRGQVISKKLDLGSSVIEDSGPQGKTKQNRLRQYPLP
jgi:hypothetical protein